MKIIVISSILFTLTFKLVVEFLHKNTSKSVQNNTSIIKPRNIEKRKRIAVIDSGINLDIMTKSYMCKDMPVYSYLDSGLDHNGHGTNVVGLIGERIDQSKYCVTSYSMSRRHSMMEVNHFLRIMQKHNVVGLNMSLASFGIDYEEGELINKLTDKGVKVFVAAGNKALDLGKNCNVYPACHKVSNSKIIVVGNKGHRSSNFGKYVDVWVDGNKKGYKSMSGTSQSTAITTGNYFSKKHGI